MSAVLPQVPIIYQDLPNIKVSRKYSKVLNIYSDIPLVDADIALRDILVPDPDYTFFKLLPPDVDVQSELSEAFQFYAQRFGIDLAKFTRTNNYWISGEHRFYPYIRQGEYSATQLVGNCSLIDYNCIEGGFVLVVGAPGINARGTYGKLEGENIIPGSVIFFGYYLLIEENNRGTIYHFRSATPAITSNNTPLRWNLDVYDYKEKLWGKSIGSTVLDKKEVTINRPVINTVTGYTPITVPVNVPTGIRQTSTAVTRTVPVNTYVSTPASAFPLTATPVRAVQTAAQSTVVSPMQSSVIESTMRVPAMAPVIRDEITNIAEAQGTSAVLLTRSIITFGNKC